MGKYDAILDLPHKQSRKRPHMSLAERAAQFAPFAALTGYDDAIAETGRLTDAKVELSEESLEALDQKFQLLTAQLDQSLEERPEVVFTYFLPDNKKSGGAYVKKRGVIKKLDDCARVITLRDGTQIQVGDVVAIEGGDAAI